MRAIKSSSASACCQVQILRKIGVQMHITTYTLTGFPRHSLGYFPSVIYIFQDVLYPETPTHIHQLSLPAPTTTDTNRILTYNLTCLALQETLSATFHLSYISGQFFLMCSLQTECCIQPTMGERDRKQENDFIEEGRKLEGEIHLPSS